MKTAQCCATWIQIMSQLTEKQKIPEEILEKML